MVKYQGSNKGQTHSESSYLMVKYQGSNKGQTHNKSSVYKLPNLTLKFGFQFKTWFSQWEIR